MDHSDRELVCAQCGEQFVFSSGEQSYFAQNGLQAPRRCKNCRAQRKNQAGDAPRAPRDGNANGNVGGARPPRRGPQQSFRPAAADDPNGYRAPAFWNEQRSAYAIDYAGLPKDEDEDNAGNTATPARDDVDRFGMRTNVNPNAPRGTGGFGGGGQRGPRGPRPQGGGRAYDRSGTDRDAYRSPAFANSAPDAFRAPRNHPAPKGPRPADRAATAPSAPRDGAASTAGAAPGEGSARSRRNQRARHEATCADCGVAALVPFQPAPDRPAYCKPCYQVRKANGTIQIPATASVAAAAPVTASDAPVASTPVASDNAGE